MKRMDSTGFEPVKSRGLCPRTRHDLTVMEEKYEKDGLDGI